MDKLGLIAGGGDLPRRLAEGCVAAGRSLFVVRLKGFAEADMVEFPSVEAGIAEIGKVMDALKAAGAVSVCFAGNVARPDLSKLKPDLRGLRVLPGAIAAARKGDDALLRFLLAEFEGFRIEGAHEVEASLTLNPGALGAISPGAAALDDIAHALKIARAIGALDIGQGAVVVDGLVLAVEAQEGTDGMLERVRHLPAALKGEADARRGVLAKCPKPIQELRVDLPTIGVATVEAVAACGLAGIVGEAGRMLVMDRAGVIAAADRLGLFVYGVAPEALS
jgi:UDP-2,3-diacylglucosamine hydrolase